MSTTMQRERGAGTVLTISIALVVIAVFAVVILQMQWLNGSRQARQAADLVALTAGRAHAAGGVACDSARDTAQRNDVQVDSCEVEVGYGEFIVDVCVTKEIEPAVASFQPTTRVCSRAGVIHD